MAIIIGVVPQKGGVGKSTIARLVAREFAAHAADDPELAPLADSTVLAAEVRHAVCEEMAMTLGDVVCRRTDLATGEPPCETALIRAAELMGREFGWGPERLRAELGAVRGRFRPVPAEVA